MAREFGLGRLRNVQDARNARFRMMSSRPQIEAALGAPKPRKMPYKEGPQLNQGMRPWCVEFSVRGFVNAAPLMSGIEHLGQEGRFYAGCQDRDEWPGNNYDGTSVHASMRYGVELGLFESYAWGQTPDEAISWMNGGYGTIIIGTWWYPEMDEVDSDGFIKEPSITSTPIGGHAYRVNWYDMKIAVPKKKTNRRGYLIKNSWGFAWGRAKRGGTYTGDAYMSDELFARLLREEGEIAAPVQIKLKPVIV